MTRHFLGPPGWFYACWLLHAVNIRRRDLTAFPRARMCAVSGGEAKIARAKVYKFYKKERAEIVSPRPPHTAGLNSNYYLGRGQVTHAAITQTQLHRHSK